MALTFGVSAQEGGHSNYVGLNFGGGLNTMIYNPTRGDQSLGLGFDAGLHFAHFFNKGFGLGFGVHYTCANAYTLYNFNEVSSGLVHADNGNLHYDLTSSFNNWKERQTVSVLSIPIEAFYRVALSEKWQFIGGLGFQIDLPVYGNYGATEGSYTTTGTFSFFGSYVVSDMPNHGFSTYDGTFDAKIDNLVPAVSILADAGMRMALDEHWGLYLGLYASYGLTNMLEEPKEAPLLMVDNTDASKLDYNGTFASNEIDALHLLRVGMKVGIDFGWPEVPLKLEEPEPVLVPVDRSVEEKETAEKAAREKTEAERLSAEKAAREKAEAERIATEKAAREKAEAERMATEQSQSISSEAIEEILKGITINFSYNSTRPRYDETTDNNLHRLCDAMQSDTSISVLVVGHADNIGTRKNNKKIGRRRATVVKRLMVKLGAPAKSIDITTRGESKPLESNRTKAGRAHNRRVTLELK